MPSGRMQSEERCEVFVITGHVTSDRN